MCNVAYSIQTENMSEEERENFDGEIGMTENFEAIAREDLRRYQEQMGIHFDDPNAPVAAQPGTRDEEFH